MSQTKNINGVHFLYEAKVFFPMLICLALLAGMFQNCSSKFGEGRDPVADQNRIQGITPIALSDQSQSIIRLEGTPLQMTAPTDIFADQGLTTCTTATYTWSYLSDAANATQSSLAETSSVLQIPSLDLSDEGNYYLDSTCNGQSYQLGPIDLEVIPKLKVLSSSITNQTVSEGSPANLNATFGGPTPITYQWYFLPSNGAKVALAGQTGQQFDIANAQLSDQGDYELVATSTEGGIAQSLTAGPGKLTVLPMSSIAGNVSGTTHVQTTQPIQLTSAVSGAVNPDYQWYHNSVLINGANSPNFDIPSAVPTDAGTYSLVVTDQGQTYQIGSVNVVVTCAPGQMTVNGQCFENSRVCTVSNGSGVQFLATDGTYGICNVTACNPGYVNHNNACVPAQTSCGVPNGTGIATFGSGGQPGQCIVQTCDPGYVNINNTCQQQVCSIQNGVGLMQLENGSLVCKIQYCNTNFVKYQNSCVPRTQSCTIQNGQGNREYTESGPGDCNVTTCNAGYVNIQNSCVKRDCDIANGQGVIALSPGGSIQCRAVSCNSGYFMSGNQCISQVCTTGTGTGYWTTEGGQQVCKLTSCSGSGKVLINNQCVDSACPISNGTGSIAINANNQTYCKATSCNSGYAIQGNACVSADGSACSINNGTGILANGGTQCLVNSCNSGYVAYSNQCVEKLQSCTIPNGTGQQTFTVSGPGACVVQSCDSGYVRQGNQCVPKNQACFIQNGTGYREAYSNGFGECIVESCNSGYGATLTQQCLPLKRTCYMGSGQGYQYLTSYGYSACQIETCGSNETMIMGACRANEKLLCEPMSISKDAEGGKVFGYVYSLKKNKYNADINTATMSSNRLYGHVFYNKMSFSGTTGYLYDTQDQAIRHPDGYKLDRWFGLALHTQVLPPDGAYSGDYIFALSSDDGSGLDCKVNGTWNRFINHTNGNSCGTIRAATSSVNITRDRPMPIKVSYFQNSGSGRCLKLLYKKAGSSDDFKEIPESRLMLPDNTINLCPSR